MQGMPLGRPCRPGRATPAPVVCRCPNCPAPTLHGAKASPEIIDRFRMRARSTICSTVAACSPCCSPSACPMRPIRLSDSSRNSAASKRWLSLRPVPGCEDSASTSCPRNSASLLSSSAWILRLRNSSWNDSSSEDHIAAWLPSSWLNALRPSPSGRCEAPLMLAARLVWRLLKLASIFISAPQLCMGAHKWETLKGDVGCMLPLLREVRPPMPAECIMVNGLLACGPFALSCCKSGPDVAPMCLTHTEKPG